MRRAALVSLTLVVLSSAATGCGSASGSGSGSDDGGSDPGTGPIGIVASTNVWGDVASQVGGERVDVTSIISDPAQDPHSFEADSRTLLAVSKAALVIENGGGYDDFMTTMVDSSDTKADVLDAVDISGKTADEGEELNEHVWYDVPTVILVAQEVADELGRIDADHAAEYDANAKAFVGSLEDLVAQEQDAATQDAGRSVAITEPVPLYLTEAMGLTNETPEEFSEAIEEGDDVAVSVLKETLDLFSSGRVDVLVYNEQTSGPITEQVRAAAEKAGVPVVPVTETLPPGEDYLSWMQSNLTAIQDALDS